MSQFWSHICVTFVMATRAILVRDKFLALRWCLGAPVLACLPNLVRIRICQKGSKWGRKTRKVNNNNKHSEDSRSLALTKDSKPWSSAVFGQAQPQRQLAATRPDFSKFIWRASYDWTVDLWPWFTPKACACPLSEKKVQLSVSEHVFVALSMWPCEKTQPQVRSKGWQKRDDWVEQGLCFTVTGQPLC